MSVERNVYQTSKGGKVFVPLENKARIIRCATPRFARMLSSKYARLNASDVCDDLLNNHGRAISRGTVQLITERVGSIAQAKEETWEYRTPVLDFERELERVKSQYPKAVSGHRGRRQR